MSDFSKFLFEKYKHLGFAYGDDLEMVEHFMSGDVTVPFKEVILSWREFRKKERDANDDGLPEEINFNLHGTDSPAMAALKLSIIGNNDYISGANYVLDEIRKYYILPCAHMAGDKVQLNYGPGMVSNDAKVVKVHLSGFTTTYDIDTYFELPAEGNELPYKYKTRHYNVDSAFVHRVNSPSEYKKHIIEYKD